MKANYIPENCHAVTPYLVVPNAARLLEFAQQAFGGVVGEKFTRPDGGVLHAQVRIGDSLLMVGEPPAGHHTWPTVLYLYVPDCDATYRQAVAAGGESQTEPTDMFYGDRTASVKDPVGNMWWIATHKEVLTTQEIQQRAAKFFAEKAKQG
ncbi:MAG TPA: VOC family protein [Pirellulales bacterium]|nr:VOC family protein [Pirellulales bacterium]